MNSERTALLAIVTVALLAALITAPAAARAVTSGNTIYVGEEDLGISAVFQGAGTGTLVHFGSLTDRTVVGAPITVADTTSFGLTAFAVGTRTGTWHAFAAGADYSNPAVAPLGNVLVQTPSTNLNVLLGNTGTTSVDGRTVTRSSAIRFRVDHNLAALADPADPNYNVIEIRLTTPGGGTVTSFGSPAQSLVLPLTGQWTETNPINLTGATAGTYTGRGVWPTAAGLGSAYNTNAVSFEVISGAVAITSNKDTVVRGNSFTVTITGESGQDYFLTLQNPGAQPPTFRANQVGVTPTADPTNVTIRTTAAGTRSVELTSTTATREASYTLRVTDSRDANRYDEVRVRVETGSVTITTSGTGVYYLGEELVISGTNTDSNNVYLFLTGPNLPANGVRLDGSMSPVENNNATSFTSTPVEADDTWSYKWDTGSITRSLDAGGYTIYAISEPRSKESLSDVKYGTTTIQLRPPSLTARPSSTTLIPGGEYWISGTATGNPPNVNVWIFGKNYYGAPGELHVITANVESDGTFECVLTGAETSTLQKGQYYVIVQHPGSMGFGVAQGDAQLGQNTNSIYRSYYNGVTNVFVATLTNLQAPEAANALISALESPYVDDIYIKFSFTVGDASWIRIDGLGDQTYGETFMVAGTTSFPAGKALAYWITEGGTVALSDVVVVTDNGDWNFEVDTTVIGPGAFTLHITAPEDHASAIALFDVYDDIVHPVPPGGGSYRVERLDVTPSLDSLTPGDGAVLDGVIRLDDTLGSLYSPLASRTLEFSTDLQDPVWSYNLRVDGNVLYAEPMIVNARSFALSGWDLDYQGDVRILLSLSGTTPSADSENPVLLRILEREGDGRVVPNSEHRLSIPLSDDPAPLSVDNLTLSPGWNFVSIPRPLAAGNDTAAIFSDVKADGHSAFRYDTAHGTWMNLTKTDRLAPLEGYWIYSAGPATVPLNFSTDPLISPAERALAAGWNAVGITGSTPATARDAFHSVKGQWSNLIGYNAGAQTFETGIVNSGTGANADTRPVYPGRGYWLSMTGPGTLYAIGA